jgi:predicted naringenin-chalcone synthase
LGTTDSKFSRAKGDAMTAHIWTVGTALPKYSIEQAQAAKLAQALGLTERWTDALPRLYGKSGVKRRGSVLLEGPCDSSHPFQSFYQPRTESAPFGPSTSDRMKAYAEHAGPLVEQACRRAMIRASMAPSEVTHLVSVSCTGFISPGIDHWMIRELELNRNIQRTHVGFMGCHGLINGLRVAQSIADSDPDAIVLVGAVELCSLHQQFTEDPQQLVANALFADGAAAAIVSGHTPSDCGNNVWEVTSSFSWMIPETESHMGWTVGNHGFEMRLSPEVPALIESKLAEPVDNWLRGIGVDVGEIDLWAVHPGGPRILDGVTKAFRLDESLISPSRQILEEHGNMSSPTVLFILQRVSELNDNAKSCLLVAFGPGLHAELMLLRRPNTAP